MAQKTKVRLKLLGLGLLFLTGITGAIADSAGVPVMPAGTPVWLWAVVTVILGGGTFIGAVATARNQAKKTALEEFQALHEAERKRANDCEERSKAQQIQIDAHSSMILRLQTKNQRYMLSNHRLRSFVAALAMQAKVPMPDMSILVDDINNDEHET